MLRSSSFREGTHTRTAGGRPVVTHSRKVFIPLTDLCLDTHGYCTFAWPLNKDLPALLSSSECSKSLGRGGGGLQGGAVIAGRSGGGPVA